VVLVDFIIESLFWAFVGAAGTVVWFKATHSCIDTLGAITCIPHSFNLMSAFGV
jgi:hypothetical protein